MTNIHEVAANETLFFSSDDTRDQVDILAKRHSYSILTFLHMWIVLMIVILCVSVILFSAVIFLAAKFIRFED